MKQRHCRTVEKMGPLPAAGLEFGIYAANPKNLTVGLAACEDHGTDRGRVSCLDDHLRCDVVFLEDGFSFVPRRIFGRERDEWRLVEIGRVHGILFRQGMSGRDSESSRDFRDDDDVLVCDDLGDEWADFIGLDNQASPPRITFYHAKHGEVSLGAGPFHVAVSQALKNLRNMSLPPDVMPAKVAVWQNCYFRNWSSHPDPAGYPDVPRP